MQEAMTAKAEASQPLTTRPIDPLAESSVVTVTPPTAEVVVVVVVVGVAVVVVVAAEVAQMEAPRTIPLRSRPPRVGVVVEDRPRCTAPV